MDKTIITMLICLMLALYQVPAAGKTKTAEETLAAPTTAQPLKTDKAPAPSLSKPQPAPVKPAPTLRVKPDKTEIVKKTAELAIKSFACSPASIKTGASTTLRAVIANTGTATADNVSIVFLLDGKKIDEKQKLQIKPKQSIQVSASYRPEQTGRLALQARIESRATGTKIGRAGRTAETTLLVNAAPMVRPSLSTKPQDMVSPVKPGTRLSATPSAVQGTRQQPSPPADLAVEQLRYHEDLSAAVRGTRHGTKPGISFIVRNTGTTRIDPEQFRRSLLKIVVDRQPLAGSSRLGQLVSYESIAKPGSQATAAIPVELPDRVLVAVTINSNSSIFELNSANNATGALLGGSPAGPQRIGGDGSKTESIAADRGQLPGRGKPGRSDSRDQISAPGTKPGTDRLGDRQMSLSRPATGKQQSIGDVTPRLLDHGIEIISPNFEDVYSPSSLISIRYRFSRPVAAGGTVVFTAVGGGEVVATETIRNDNPPGPTDPHRQVQLQLPGGIGAGLYLIDARHEASGAVGLSDAFRVIFLHAEEIGDAGGFGGDGTETEPMQAYPVEAGDSIGDGDGTTRYHDLALSDVWMDPTHKRLTALVQNNGDAFDAEVEFVVDLEIFGSVRTIERRLAMAAGERLEVVLHQFDPAVISRYRHECGVPLSVVISVPEWQRSIPDASSANDQIEKTLYLPGGGIRIANSELVVRRDGFGGGGTVADNGMLDWARDFAIERRNESSRSDFETSLIIKNCDARPFNAEETMVLVTARGTWACGDGSLGSCHHEEVIFGPAPYVLRLNPGEQAGFDLPFNDLRHTNLTILIEASAIGYDDDFQFFLGWRD